MERIYKSAASAKSAARLKLRRDAIKAAGGEEYEKLLERERLQKKRHRSNGRPAYDRISRKTFPFRTLLCASARQRGRKRGIGATITPADIEWPTHCPVLGIELDYPERSGRRGKDLAKPNWPSLDRRDPNRGYVPGNVFVISFRANTLKNNGSLQEFEALCAYLRMVRCEQT